MISKRWEINKANKASPTFTSANYPERVSGDSAKKGKAERTQLLPKLKTQSWRVEL